MREQVRESAIIPEDTLYGFPLELNFEPERPDGYYSDQQLIDTRLGHLAFIQEDMEEDEYHRFRNLYEMEVRFNAVNIQQNNLILDAAVNFLLNRDQDFSDLSLHIVGYTLRPFLKTYAARFFEMFRILVEQHIPEVERIACLARCYEFLQYFVTESFSHDAEQQAACLQSIETFKQEYFDAALEDVPRLIPDATVDALATYFSAVNSGELDRESFGSVSYCVRAQSCYEGIAQLLLSGDLSYVREQLHNNIHAFIPVDQFPQDLHEIIYLHHLLSDFLPEENELGYSADSVLDDIIHVFVAYYIQSDTSTVEMKSAQFIHVFIGLTPQQFASGHSFIRRAFIAFNEHNGIQFHALFFDLVIALNMRIDDDAFNILHQLYLAYYSFNGTEASLSFIRSCVEELFSVDALGNFIMKSSVIFGREEPVLRRFQRMFVAMTSYSRPDTYLLLKHMMSEQINAEMARGFYADESLTDKLQRVGANVSSKISDVGPHQRLLLQTATAKLSEELRYVYPDEVLNFDIADKTLSDSFSQTETYIWNCEREYFVYGAVDFACEIITKPDEDASSVFLMMLSSLRGDISSYVQTFVQAFALVLNSYDEVTPELTQRGRRQLYENLKKLPQTYLNETGEEVPFLIEDCMNIYDTYDSSEVDYLRNAEYARLGEYFTHELASRNRGHLDAEYVQSASEYSPARYRIWLVVLKEFLASPETSFSRFVQREHPDFVAGLRMSSLHELHLRRSLFQALGTRFEDVDFQSIDQYLNRLFVEDEKMPFIAKICELIIDYAQITDRHRRNKNIEIGQALFAHAEHDVSVILAEFFGHTLRGNLIFGLSFVELVDVLIQFFPQDFRKIVPFFMNQHFTITQDGEYAFTFMNGKEGAQTVMAGLCEHLEPHHSGTYAVIVLSIMAIKLTLTQYIENQTLTDVPEEELHAELERSIDQLAVDFPQINSFRDGMILYSKRQLEYQVGDDGDLHLMELEKRHRLRLQRLYPPQTYSPDQSRFNEELEEHNIQQMFDYFAALIAFRLDGSQQWQMLAVSIRFLLHSFIANNLDFFQERVLGRLYRALVACDRSQDVPVLELIHEDLGLVSRSYNEEVSQGEKQIDVAAHVQQYASLSPSVGHEVQLDAAFLIQRVTDFQDYGKHVLSDDSVQPPEKASGSMALLYMNQRIIEVSQNPLWSVNKRQRYLNATGTQLSSRCPMHRTALDVGNTVQGFNRLMLKHQEAWQSEGTAEFVNMGYMQESFQNIVLTGMFRQRSTDLIIAQTSRSVTGVFALNIPLSEWLETVFNGMIAASCARTNPAVFDQVCAATLQFALEKGVSQLDLLFELIIHLRSEGDCRRIIHEYLFDERCGLLHPFAADGKRCLNTLFTALNNSQYDFSSTIAKGLQHVVRLGLAA